MNKAIVYSYIIEQLATNCSFPTPISFFYTEQKKGEYLIIQNDLETLGLIQRSELTLDDEYPEYLIADYGREFLREGRSISDALANKDFKKKAKFNPHITPKKKHTHISKDGWLSALMVLLTIAAMFIIGIYFS